MELETQAGYLALITPDRFNAHTLHVGRMPHDEAKWGLRIKQLCRHAYLKHGNDARNTSSTNKIIITYLLVELDIYMLMKNRH